MHQPVSIEGMACGSLQEANATIEGMTQTTRFVAVNELPCKARPMTVVLTKRLSQQDAWHNGSSIRFVTYEAIRPGPMIIKIVVIIAYPVKPTI